MKYYSMLIAILSLGCVASIGEANDVIELWVDTAPLDAANKGDPRKLIADSDQLVFLSSTIVGRNPQLLSQVQSLWRTDGTRANTRNIALSQDISFRRIEPHLLHNGLLAAGVAVPGVNGSSQRMQLISTQIEGQVTRLTNISHHHHLRDVTSIDGKLFWAGDRDNDGMDPINAEPYVYDASGGRLLKDINEARFPGINDFFGSAPTQFTPLDNNSVLFAATERRYDRSNNVQSHLGENYGTGRELWRTDGTTTGTTLVKNIFPDGPPSVSDTRSDADPEQLTRVGPRIFFSARDGTHGRELWITDGTESGTVLVKDINQSGSTIFGEFFDLNGQLLFTADDGISGLELWISDGTESGTRLLADINSGIESSEPLSYTQVGDDVYFSAFDAVNGRELWVTDGTFAGTRLVADIKPGSDSSAPRGLTSLANRIYFSASDNTHGLELWVSNGQSAGTKIVQDLLPGPEGSQPEWLTVFRGAMYYVASDGVVGREVWRMTPALDITYFGRVAELLQSNDPVTKDVMKDIAATVSAEFGINLSPNWVSVVNRFGPSDATNLETRLTPLKQRAGNYFLARQRAVENGKTLVIWKQRHAQLLSIRTRRSLSPAEAARLQTAKDQISKRTVLQTHWKTLRDRHNLILQNNLPETEIDGTTLSFPYQRYLASLL